MNLLCLINPELSVNHRYQKSLAAGILEYNYDNKKKTNSGLSLEGKKGRKRLRQQNV